MVFRHSKKWYFWASWIVWAVGVLFCVLPPLIATIANFPVMVSKDAESTVSMIFVLGVIMSASLLILLVVKAFKQNAALSVSVVLAVLCAVFVLGYNIEKETLLGLAWVAGSGAVGTLLGQVCFKIHAIWHDLYKNCGEVYITNGTN